MPSSVRTKRSSRGSAPVSSRTACSTAAVSISISSPAAVSRSGSRCVCTLVTSGTSAGSLPRPAPRCRVPGRAKVARKLQVQGDLDAAVDVEDLEVVDLAHARDRERGGEHPLAESAGALARLDVDDDVDTREGALKRLLHAVGGRMTLPDRGARSDADDDVREVLSSGPSQSKPPELDRRDEWTSARRAILGVVLGRPVHEYRRRSGPRAGVRRRRRGRTESARSSRQPGSRPPRRSGRRERRGCRRSRSRSGARWRGAHRFGKPRPAERHQRPRGVDGEDEPDRRERPPRRIDLELDDAREPQDAAIAIPTLARMRNPASASAARFWALACPYGWPRSAGRTATDTAKNVSRAAARSVPECAASASSPRLELASPTTSLTTTRRHAAPTETSAVRRCGSIAGRLRRKPPRRRRRRTGASLSYASPMRACTSCGQENAHGLAVLLGLRHAPRS